MRKLFPPALVLLAAVLFCTNSAPLAQQGQLVPAASGDAMARKAVVVLGAFKTLSPEPIFEQLAPWKRTQAELYKARLHKRAAAKKLRWDRYEKTVRGPGSLDPAGKLGLTSMEDYLALSPAKLLGLHMGLYLVAADAGLSLHMADQWFEVDRAVGLMNYGGSSRSKLADRLLVQGGGVMFENTEGGKFSVDFVLDGNEWCVTNFEAEFGPRSVRLKDALSTLEDMTMVRNGTYVDISDTEGEQMLGSMRGQVRVAYAKMGEAPKKLVGRIGTEEYGSGVAKTELEGKYYKIRDAVYGKDGQWWGALVAEPVEQGDNWILMFFNYAGGDAEFKHFETKAQLEAALKEALDNGWGQSRDDDD